MICQNRFAAIKIKKGKSDKKLHHSLPLWPISLETKKSLKFRKHNHTKTKYVKSKATKMVQKLKKTKT